MGWIRIAGKGLEYAGRLAQAEGFEEWAAEQGRTIVESLAEKQAFSFFGRKRRAKKLLWKELQAAGKSETLSAAIQHEVTAYPKLFGEVAEIIEHNEFIAEWRTFVVPRFLVNSVALRNVQEHLSASAELERLHGGPSLQAYFFGQLITEIDRAFTSIPLSLKDPAPTAHGWLAIGYDSNHDWKSRQRPGHYYVVQTRGKEIDKRRRAQLDNQLNDLRVLLGRLIRKQVDDLVEAWNAWLARKTNIIGNLP